MKKKKTTKKDITVTEIWDSGFRISEAQIIVPHHISEIITEVQERINNNEYSILLKGQWEKQGFVIGTDYIIPKQKVLPADVTYIDDISILREQQGYNVVVHSHPFLKDSTSGWFSAADETTINIHFPCSLLLNGIGQIVAANLNIETTCPGKWIKIRLGYEDIFITKPSREIEIEGVENIQISTVKIGTQKTLNLVDDHLYTKHNHVASQYSINKDKYEFGELEQAIANCTTEEELEDLRDMTTNVIEYDRVTEAIDIYNDLFKGGHNGETLQW